MVKLVRCVVFFLLWCLMGYVCVFIEDQFYDVQVDELCVGGCDWIYQEYGLGVFCVRLVFVRLLRELIIGDVFVVV